MNRSGGAAGRTGPDQAAAGRQQTGRGGLALQEARELLAAYAEALDEAGRHHLAEELLSANSAAEIASACRRPQFNQQLQDSLQVCRTGCFK